MNWNELNKQEGIDLDEELSLKRQPIVLPAGAIWLSGQITTSGTKEHPLIKWGPLEPMTPGEFATWLWEHTQNQPDGSFPSPKGGTQVKGIWKAELDEKGARRLSNWREEWNKQQRKHPQAGKKELDELTRKALGEQRKWKQAFQDVIDEELGCKMQDALNDLLADI